VTDNSPEAINEKSLSATGSFQITVNEVNSAPELTGPGDQSVDELASLVLNATAVDGDIVPNNALTFELVSGPPGLTVNAAGEIRWTPTEAQGPGDYAVTIKVTDNGVPPASASKSFKISVREVNQAPTLEAIPDQIAHAAGTFRYSLRAADADDPANTLTFALVSGPAEAAVDAATGQFTWPIPEERAGTTSEVTLSVRDGGNPELTNSVKFNISVVGPLKITSFGLSAQGVFSATWNTIPGLSYALEFKESLNATEWTRVGAEITASGVSASRDDTNAVTSTHRLYRVRQTAPWPALAVDGKLRLRL
jgi:hypothetical protein